MKIYQNRIRLLGSRSYFLLYPDGTPRPFFVDRRFLRKVTRVRWRFIETRQRARGFFGRGTTRQYLHRYIVQLAGYLFPEVTFANGDPFDCRMVNLKPYRREEDGASRKPFKNNTSRQKGVCFHKRKQKWAAMIRVNTRLVHLGYHDTALAAAQAYAAAFKIAHPNLKL